ncbi:hypothetical protein [Massilia sp. Root335]|uniref:hypothetical protein n=1 Tax=Massilia sp. Root335 TaxID=1736517 RepID=UPI000A81B7AA|nr:hypothetical protein [Massilia sp. Root335]
MIDQTGDEQKQHAEFSAEVNFAATTAVKRYAEATAEHCRSIAELEKIARYQVNPEYREKNLHQQAGKAAEVKHVARTNAENAIARDPSRIARTDNVGYPNHQEFDFVEVDPANGPVSVDGTQLTSGGQMKVHKDIEKYRDHFKGNFDKYRRAELVVPGDQFDLVMKDWAAEQNSLVEQRDKLRSLGQDELARQKQEAIDRIEDARSRLKRSDVSSVDAMEARTSPTFSAVKDVLDVSHRAGIEAAKSSAAIGGGMSAVRNLVAVVRSGKPLDEAALDVCKDVGVSAAGAYVSAAASTTIGGALQAANSQVMQNLGRSNAPAMAVQVAATMGKSIIELASGRMSSEDFVRNVTKDGSMLAVSMTGSNLGAIVGTAVLPGVGTLVGGLVGGMVASMLGGQLHAELMRSVANLDASSALRQRTQALCLRLKAQHEAYKVEMHAAFDVFFREKSLALKQGFDLISAASAEGASIHDGLSRIAVAMNKDLAFGTREAFSSQLRSGRALEF